jgi:hypothetical protein
MSNITSLPWTKEDREKRRKRRGKAQEGTNTKLAPKNNRSAPARKITMNKNENMQAS